MRNRIKELFRAGKPAFGAHIKLPTATSVEVAGVAGLDFVRFDLYHWPYNPETMENMIRTAYSYGMTSLVRCRKDPWVIMNVLDMGVQGVIMPRVRSVAEARAAVNAVYYPPKGEREENRPLRFRRMPVADYNEWASTQMIVGCSIEDLAGLESLPEIVKLEGIDVIASGPGDLALALGVPGERNHPKVQEAWKRALGIALEAGKQISLTVAPTPEGLESAQRWMEQGARLITIDDEYKILLRGYEAVLGRLGPVQQKR
jgi:4-hydroxy-2-oxoheptanedioate aldolase